MKQLIIVFKINEITEMMKCFDVFEAFKCVANVHSFKVTKPISLKKMRSILDGEMEGLEPILVAYLDGDKKPKVVFNEQYKVYSDGTKWTTREDFIKSLKAL